MTINSISSAPRAPFSRFRLALLIAVLVLGIAVFLSLFAKEQAEPFILLVLAALSVVGIFGLFGWLSGLIGFAQVDPLKSATQDFSDEAMEGFLVTTMDGQVLYANRAYSSLLSIAPDALPLPPDRLFAQQADASETFYRLMRAVREGGHHSEDLLIANGSPRWLRMKVHPLPYSRVGWIVQDITQDRFQFERSVQTLQDGLEHLEKAPVGFFVYHHDGRVLHLNATLAQWLGYDVDDPALSHLTLAALIAGDGSALLAATAGQVKKQGVSALDLDLKTRKGQRLSCLVIQGEREEGSDRLPFVRTVVLPHLASKGQSGDALRDAERRFARFFNNTPMAIATIDIKGRMVRTNAPFARLFFEATKVDAKPGRPVLSMVAESDRAAVDLRLKSVLAQGGRGDVLTLDVPLAGDAQRSARVFATAVSDEESGEGEVAILYLLETTEQRALELQFAQSQKMQAIGQLAGGVAHDFNNVLTAIIGYSDLLLSNHRATDPSFQDIMQIKQNATRAAGLVRQLLAFSRRQTLRPSVISLVDVVADLDMMLKRLLGETITLDVRHGRDLWLVKADLNQFEQVIVNLCVNARDAMVQGGQVRIRSRNLSRFEAERFADKTVPAEDFVLIEVEDTGTGIPADIRDKIFEPFFTTKDVGKGTGLGLSMVYGFVKQTGGYLFCQSEVGQGTTFQILLPRHIPEVDAAPVKVEVAAPTMDLTGTGTILLVEDEDAVRAFGARALGARGYHVLEAASGLEALAVMEEQVGAVDLVVTDVMMPEMDGPTLARELRKTYPNLKIIFVSGYAEDTVRKDLEDQSDIHFLPKPFTLKDLVEKVKSVIVGE
jgi:two-component system, cell cycle sensor histidine kinase and response regulator CckA